MAWLADLQDGDPMEMGLVVCLVAASAAPLFR